MQNKRSGASLAVAAWTRCGRLLCLSSHSTTGATIHHPGWVIFPPRAQPLSGLYQRIKEVKENSLLGYSVLLQQCFVIFSMCLRVAKLWQHVQHLSNSNELLPDPTVTEVYLCCADDVPSAAAARQLRSAEPVCPATAQRCLLRAVSFKRLCRCGH